MGVVALGGLGGSSSKLGSFSAYDTPIVGSLVHYFHVSPVFLSKLNCLVAIK